MRKESIECSDFKEGNCPLCKNPNNNIIKHIYPPLLYMHQECCKKSTHAEEFMDIMFFSDKKLFEAKISMMKESGVVSIAAIIAEL